ncbi:cysteine--tRNA ligase [Aliikangiella sp. G2MR2-5]|uniref:cysteine--tRNA ligase n=1 Tax=Aliikangiella sp. G2MR2-5 TaxID=2788943 RepID=UPI0018AC4976|nr:cysteine--tRNA ligase [Aliikangiella sp. G2MR2-5]
MKLSLYNTLLREKETFKPINQDSVGFYSCGPTVYSRAHLGNMRAYIFADLLKRTLLLSGYSVNHVMNITDVGHLTDDADDGDDKLALRAKKEKVTAWELALRYEDLFFADCKALNIRRPDIVCRATDHIKEQIDMISRLEEKGFTYLTDDGVYFDTSRCDDYGKLARLDIEGLREGERVDIGQKKSKTDFALWKFSPKDSQRDMEWDSPWGKGFPGWHIECSAMSCRYLGESFDIHTGGTDHIPIHHTNEIAQSECANGTHPFVRYWMHCQFLVFPSGEKISKSLGHDLSIDGLRDKGIDPLAYRYLCLTAHYRNFLNYTEEAIQAAEKSLKRLRALCQKFGYVKGTSEAQDRQTDFSELMQKFPQVFEPLMDDLNSAKMIAAFWDILKDDSIDSHAKLELITAVDSVLGVSLELVDTSRSLEVPANIQSLVEQRNAARNNKDWSLSDKLRDEIEVLGYRIEDTREGTLVSRLD